MAPSYSCAHLSDQTLLLDLATRMARERGATAEVLASLAEVDARKLYLPAGYPSMFAYCVQELHLSEDAAYKRIRAARAARQFPAIFAAVAEGRLHLAAVVLLVPYLTPETADELLAAAVHKSKAEIEQILAERFPRPDIPARVQPLLLSPAPAHASDQLALGPVQIVSPATILGSAEQLSAQTVAQLAAGRVDPPAPRPRVAPLAPERFSLQVTIGQATHDKLRYAQALLSHSVPSGDVAEVLDRALDALIRQLEKTRFAATAKPRPNQQHLAPSGRYIPAEVKRAVWKRDGGQCTFVTHDGRRCSARTLLEYDHIDPVARGGQATVGRIRLRCRAHNQYGAECAFGTEFMSRKRQEAQRRAGERARPAAEQSKERDVSRPRFRDIEHVHLADRPHPNGVRCATLPTPGRDGLTRRTRGLP